MQKKNVINDCLLWLIIIILFCLWLKGWHDIHQTLNPVNKISLDYSLLPYYTFRTNMRIILGLLVSFGITFIFGVLAAKYKALERVILPLVNFMESIPLVGFLTFTTVFFVALYPNSILGLEIAAIFGVVTGQVWNMILIFYQTLKIIPKDLQEVARIFHHNSWQRFWKIECPYSMPGLLWNTMVSQSAAWFAILATEAIPVKTDTIELPGVGSFMAEALIHANMHAVILSVLAVVLNIILLDQFLFRPLVCWTTKFKYEETESQNKPKSIVYNIIINSYSSILIFKIFRNFCYFFIYPVSYFISKSCLGKYKITPTQKKVISWFWYPIIIAICGYLGIKLWNYLPHLEFSKMPILMLLTGFRVFIALLISIAIFVPLGVWIGLNPKVMNIFQPIIQILAALPVNLLYPLIAILLISHNNDLGILSIFLIMMGTQWYILFNVIAGASSLPNNLLEVSRLFRVKGFLWWRKFMIPAIFPYIVTGIIAAAGGAWNAAVVSEIITWGARSTTTRGLGSYIQANSANASLAQAALGCTVMCIMVALCIVFIWKPMYKIAEKKYRIE